MKFENYLLSVCLLYLSCNLYFILGQEDEAETEAPFDLVNRVLHGRLARPGSYPFQVSLQEQRSDGIIKFCGGVIISQSWIVTAAHCYDDVTNGRPFTNDFRINAGVVNAWDRGSTSQFVPVKLVVKHPDYNSNTFKNDIALLKLKYPLRYNKYVRRISLPPRGFEATGSGKIMGWGATDNAERKSSDKLRVATIPVSARRDCEQVFGSLSPSQICLGLDSIYNACAGDSGGAFIQKYRGVDIIVGVTSFGKQGCYENDPIIYTNVASYIDFIKRTVLANSKSKKKSSVPKQSASKHPFLASLVEFNSQERSHAKICAAVILDQNWVLTAAHCFDNVESSDKGALKIKIGSTNVDDDREGDFVKIGKVILHPEYNPDDSNLENDIALIKLKQPISYSTNVAQISLPSKSFNIKNLKGTILGWQLQESGENKLTETEVAASNAKICQDTFPEMKESQLCVVRTEGECSNDSAAPLTANSNKSNFIIGLSSVLQDNCEENKPFLLTNIAYYADTIADLMKSN